MSREYWYGALSNNSRHMDINFSFPMFYLASECFDEDCIWARERHDHLPVLRPLTAILATIGVLGTAGNILVIWVFSHTRTRRQTNYLVLMLAIIDLMACVLVIPGVLVKEWFYKFNSDVLCKLWELLRNFAIISSAIILAAIAVERYILVATRADQFVKKRVTLIMIPVITVLGLCLGIPPMLGMGIYVEFDEDGHSEIENIGLCVPTELLISEQQLQFYWDFVTAFFGLLITVIITLYSLIFMTIFKQNERLRLHGRSNRVHPSANTSVATLTTSLRPSNLPPPFLGQVTVDSQNTNGSSLFPTNRLLVPRPTHLQMKGSTVKVFVSKTPSSASVQSLGGKQDSDRDKLDPKPPNKGKHVSFHEPEPSTSRASSNRSRTTYTRHGQQTENLSSHNATGPAVGVATVGTGGIDRQMSAEETQRKRRHVWTTKRRMSQMKTTQVLCTITVVYLVAFLPLFLITHNVIPMRVTVFYLYFVQNAVNPIIYSFMNQQFRTDIKRLWSQ